MQHEDARAEAAILSSAEAYRLVEEARQMREERDEWERSFRWASDEACTAADERDAALGEVERYRAALEAVRGYTLNVAVCAEAYNETESAHLWQEAADIADAALYPPVERPTK
jgi:uncharacterized coiled-coil DUF342 family protein